MTFFLPSFVSSQRIIEKFPEVIHKLLKELPVSTFMIPSDELRTILDEINQKIQQSS